MKVPTYKTQLLISFACLLSALSAGTWALISRNFYEQRCEYLTHRCQAAEAEVVKLQADNRKIANDFLPDDPSYYPIRMEFGNRRTVYLPKQVRFEDGRFDMDGAYIQFTEGDGMRWPPMGIYANSVSVRNCVFEVLRGKTTANVLGSQLAFWVHNQKQMLKTSMREYALYDYKWNRKRS